MSQALFACAATPKYRTESRTSGPRFSPADRRSTNSALLTWTTPSASRLRGDSRTPERQESPSIRMYAAAFATAGSVNAVRQKKRIIWW
jgi:hypothetical protein